ncbi:MAG: hypothetical protein MJ084_02810 [Saccharofermentans sp.]|nr:hypothetical protein [Saccharofermentans sp.]
MSTDSAPAKASSQWREGKFTTIDGEAFRCYCPSSECICVELIFIDPV